jgi:hypothetical protein
MQYKPSHSAWYKNPRSHPAKYFGAIAKLASQAGASLHSHVGVTAIERAEGGFSVRTACGDIRARDVLLQHLQEGNQVRLLLLREANLETFFVEVHHVFKRSGRPVMKIRGSRRQSVEDRSLDLSNVRAFSTEQGTAQIGDLKNLALHRTRAVDALHCEDRQTGDIEHRGMRVRDTDVDGQSFFKWLPTFGESWQVVQLPVIDV